MIEIEQLLRANKAWAKDRLEKDPLFFSRLENLQSPKFLWIGCSDSRVPANEITGTQPGEIFVHRNVANMVIHTDMNMLTVLEYAVHHLEVEHIIVCGHYGCGGVEASLTQKSYGIINKWLRNIKDVHRLYAQEIDSTPDTKERNRRMVELNVKEQVLNLAKTSIVQKAWAERKGPHLHGWVYGLDNGLIKAINDVPPGFPLDPLYVYEDFQ